MAHPTLDHLDRLARGLVAATRGTLSWSWDAGMSAALATFTSDQAPAVRAAIEPTLSVAYDAAGVRGAPAGVSDLLGALGGLRHGQLLLCSEPAAAGQVYGAWWPWGNGKTISLRVGLSAPGIAGVDRAALNECLRTAMGL